MKISYNAVIQYDDDGIWVMFPDLKGCFSTGDENRIEEMAKEAMELYLDDMDVESLPRPTSISDFNLEDNQRAVNITCDFEVRNMRGIK
jgi:predicted RNase H-like HicB family nuclease